MKPNISNTPATSSAPTPSELISVAAALGFRIVDRERTDANQDERTAEVLAQALHVWKIAEQTIRRSADTLTDADIQRIAEEADALRNWSDREIALDVFGRTDAQSGEADQRKPVTEDAIRVALRSTLHHVGTAAFYLGKARGVSAATAEGLRQLMAEMRATQEAGQEAPLNSILIDRVAGAFVPQSGPFDEIRAELTQRVTQLDQDSKRKRQVTKHAALRTK